MSVRDSFSRLKGKFELKSRGKRRKQGATTADTDGEGLDPVESLPRPPVPHVVAGGGHDLGVGGSNADRGQVRSADWLPRPGQSESMPNDQEEGADIDREEVSRVYSHPHPDLEVVGSGPARGDIDEGDGEEFYSCSSNPSTPGSEESNGT